ncbi:putative integral membrane protein [Cryptosporidium meleagridis]
MQLSNCLTLIIFVFTFSFLSLEHRNEKDIIYKSEVSLLKLRSGVQFGETICKLICCCKSNGNNSQEQDLRVFAIDNSAFNGDDNSGNHSSGVTGPALTQNPANTPTTSSDSASTSQLSGGRLRSSPIPIPVGPGSNKGLPAQSFLSPCSPGSSGHNMGFFGMSSSSGSTCIHRSSSSSSLSSSSSSSSEDESQDANENSERKGKRGHKSGKKSRSRSKLRSRSKSRSRSPSLVFEFDD